MVHIITKREIWGEAEDFTDAINAIEENPEEFEPGEKVLLVDFETKLTMFLKLNLKVEEY